MRLRVRFTKHGKVRFTSHRDLARVWERTLRRTGLPVAYSAGFSPRPRLHFGLALSVGHESWAEYLDVDLADAIDAASVAALPARFSDILPVGVDCTAVSVLTDDDDGRSLQEAVSSSSWTISLDGGTAAEAAAAVAGLVAATELVVTRERKGKAVSDDIRPYVRTLTLDPPPPGGDEVVLRAEIGTQPRALRPAELVAALGPQWRERRVCRLNQWIIDHEGTRREPLALPAVAGAASWAHAPAGAT